MAFTNLFFIFAFLPVVLILYYICKKPLPRNILLFLASLVFYGWGSPGQVVLLLIVTLWIYVCGMELGEMEEGQKRKISLWVSVGFLLLILALYKYLNFWISSLDSMFGWHISTLGITLPTGLSFYIFSAISYLADVYMYKAPAQKNLLYLGIYTSFFGKISMGPISEYHQMENQLAKRNLNPSTFGHGCLMFVKGLAKKAILADQLAYVFSSLGGDGSVLGAWMIGLSYTWQLYFDFSGYSDMAIGIGHMFGFDIPRNFDHPYIADSVQNFWRRWHISLSTWFRDYVYIPLGGSRVGTAKYVRNILIVWCLTGIWHGPNMTFVVWGLYYGLLLLFEHFFFKKVLDVLPKVIRVLLIFLVADIGWIFFSSGSLSEAFSIIGHMFFIGADSFASQNASFLLGTYWFFFLLAALFSLPIAGYIKKLILARGGNAGVWVNVLVGVLLLAVSLVFLVSATSQSFLYAAF